MANQPPSLPASDPYRWHESVLSTRSLSYMSTISAFGNTGIPSPAASRNASIAHMHPPPQSMDEDSEYELEMADSRERARTLAETLPNSVAGSNLFALPLEIRERIWRHCLVAEDTQLDWPPPTPYFLDLAPQLLRTCKIIFAEAAPILYAHNKFGFVHPTDANVFVRAMTSPDHAEMIQHLSFHIHTKDTRLWLAYLGSGNQFRSLKRDFPNLRELTVRFKSMRWSHNAPIDVNLRLWSEDRHLEELTDILRQNYFPPSQHLNASGPGEEQLNTGSYEDGDSEMQDALRDTTIRSKLKELRRLQEKALQQTKVVRVRIITMCRVHPAQFQTLTAPPTQEEIALATPSTSSRPHNAQSQLLRLPVREGEEFLGFTAIDFKGRGARKPDMVSANGATTQVARTPFQNRKGVMWALEIFAFN